MKTILILLLSLSYLFTSAQGIDFFHGTFEEAKALAKEEGKLIFMDAYATWCGPCKRMAKNVFPKKEAGDYFNANFVNLKMDMEKGEGKSLARKYKVRSYPTLLFLDYNGDVVFETKGARRTPADLIKVAQLASGKPNESAIKAMDKKYADGNRDSDFLMKYISAKSNSSKDFNEIFKSYIDGLSEDDKTKKEVSSFIFQQTTSISSPGMEFLKGNKNNYIQNLGKEVFDKKINNIALVTASKGAKKADAESLELAKALLKKMKTADFKKQISFIETKYYGLAKDWINYDKVVTKYLKKYKKDDDKAMNKVAWNYYMNIDDTKKLEKAEKWMQSAIKIENTYQNNLTQSYLLYKLKRYSEAQDAVEYALILSKESSKKNKNAQILKNKIEQALEGKKKEVVIEYELN